MQALATRTELKKATAQKLKTWLREQLDRRRQKPNARIVQELHRELCCGVLYARDSYTLVRSILANNSIKLRAAAAKDLKKLAASQTAFADTIDRWGGYMYAPRGLLGSALERQASDADRIVRFAIEGTRVATLLESLAKMIELPANKHTRRSDPAHVEFVRGLIPPYLNASGRKSAAHTPGGPFAEFVRLVADWELTGLSETVVIKHFEIRQAVARGRGKGESPQVRALAALYQEKDG